MAADRRRPSGGALHTLKRTAALFSDSRHAILPVVAAALLPLLALFFATHPSATRLLNGVMDGLRLVRTLGPDSPHVASLAVAAAEDARQFLAVEAVAGMSAFVVSWSLMVAVINVLAAAHSGRELTLPDMLGKLKLSWKRTLITELTTTTLRLCYSALFVTLLCLIALASNGSLSLLAPTAILCLLAVIHVESILHLSSAVSVLEKEYCGLSALWRARELMGGRGREAFGLSLVLSPAGVVVFGGLYVVKGDEVWFGVAETCLCVVMAALVFGAWAVFYCECVERRGEVVGVLEDSEKSGDASVNFPGRIDLV